MIPVSGIYQDVQDALIAQTEVPIALFNRYSKLAELKTIDWITGDINGNTPPEPYLTQKTKDFVAPFIEIYEAHITGGIITRPADYYSYENMVKLGAGTTSDCESTDPPEDKGNTPITLLDGAQFTMRQRTFIKELKPSFKKPIAKEVGKNFEFFPKDLGSIRLEYYRYPKFANIVPTLDQQYNQEVPDEALSTNYEWDEKARPVLLWFLIDLIANRTSNQSMKQFNAADSKTGHP